MQHTSCIWIVFVLVTSSSADDLTVKVRSEACEDQGRGAGCGVASIIVNGKEYSKQKRGYNFVVLNGATGNLKKKKAFDTMASEIEVTKMINFLSGIAQNDIVLVAIQDEASGSMTPNGYQALLKVGAVEPMNQGFRSSFALIGFSSPIRPSFVKQLGNTKGKGPSTIETVIQVGPTTYTIVVRTGSKSRSGTLDGPGTDAAIEVMLYGTSQTTNQEDHTEPLKLSGSILRNYFETGQTDTFKDVKDSKILTQIKKIQVKRSNFGVGPDWLLDQITVTTADGNSYNFNPNLWLTENDKFYDVQNPAPSPTVNPANTKYTIVVKTGAKSRSGILDGPGTDAAIEVVLYGKSKTTNQEDNTAPLKLSGSILRNYFETGQTDTFTDLQDSKDLTQINKIQIKRNNFGVGPDWLLDQITVTTADGNSYNFNPNIWLTKTDNFYDVVNTKYTIVVKTGAKSRSGILDGPGTDAAIEVVLYGKSKTTNQEDRTAPLKLSGSILRNYFETGQTDTFKDLQDSKDLTQINKIQVKRNNFGVGPDWLLDQITITTADGNSYNFNPNIWLTKTDNFYDVANTKYTIAVKTGTKSRSGILDGPGTDAAIEVVLYGKSKTTNQEDRTAPLKLSGSILKNYFETGQTDTFTDLQDSKDLIQINKIQVKRNNFGAGPDWLLDQITITTADGNSYNFNPNLWLTKTDNFYDVANTKYTIVVKTGTKSRSGILDGPGTDAAIEVVLYGKSKTTNQEDRTAPLKLSGSILRNYFETGQTDTFKDLQDSKDLTQINKIQVKRNNFGVGPDWLLDQITVTTADGNSYNFNSNLWLTKTDNFYDVVNTKYTIVVKTGTKSRSGILDGPGTDAAIEVMLYGKSKTTNQEDRTAPLKLSGSILRNYFETGQTDTFKDLQDSKDLTQINKIQVKRNNFGVGPDWLLDQITVTTADGNSYNFNPNLWLTKTDNFYDVVNTKYTIVVKTGTKSRSGILDGPGTDAAIEVVLYGRSKATNQEDRTEPLKLSGSILRNYFETGQTDTFKDLQDSKDLTQINKIQVKRNNFGVGPDWLLDQITITTADGNSYNFNPNIWLTKTDNFYDVVNTKYTIVVKTGTKSRSGILDGPGTDAAIEVVLYGKSKTTNQEDRTAPLKLSGSILRNYFETGQTDTFKDLQDSKDLTQINKIQVKRNNFGVGPDWLLDQITVTTADGNSYNFNPNLWLTKTDNFYDVANAKYTIVAKTGTQSRSGILDGPGTDAAIEVVLYGRSKTTNQEDRTAPLKLSGSISRNYFETGQTDTFKDLQDLKDLTQINKIQVKRNNFGVGPDWLLDQITVTTADGSSYNFNPNLWLTKTDNFYDVVNPANTKYTIVVKTGTKSRSGILDGPGTDAAIEVVLYGKSKTTNQEDNTAPLKLSGSILRNYFETGQTDTFKDLEDLKDLTQINKIQVKRNGFGLGPDWLLDRITVTTADGKRYNFNPNLWLTEKDKFYDVKRPDASPPESPAKPAPPPPPVSPAKGITYDIIVYTGSATDSGSSANVYMTLYGAITTSSEVHLKSPEVHLKSAAGQQIFTPASSKVFQVQLENLKGLTKIKMRQDGFGPSPNWKIDKILIIAQKKRIFDFNVAEWLEPNKPLEKKLTNEISAMSIKFEGYPTCVHPLGSKVHPDPKTPLVLSDGCSQLSTLFNLLPNGVILHIVSGMCVQGDTKGDPKSIPSGSKLVLNVQCSLYSPGVDSPHALQFKFTPGGSLSEVNSGKCFASSGGAVKRPLTFSDTCDIPENKITFVDKSNNILLPEKPAEKPALSPPATPTGLSPPQPPDSSTLPKPPGTIPPLGTGKTVTNSGLSLIDPNHPEYGGNNSHVAGESLPGPCSGGCPSACQPQCAQACCGMQQSAIPQAYRPLPGACGEFCTPANCRSTCHIDCCTPRADINVWQALMMKNNPNQPKPKGHNWD